MCNNIPAATCLQVLTSNNYGSFYRNVINIIKSPAFTGASINQLCGKIISICATYQHLLTFTCLTSFQYCKQFAFSTISVKLTPLHEF